MNPFRRFYHWILGHKMFYGVDHASEGDYSSEVWYYKNDKKVFVVISHKITPPK